MGCENTKTRPEESASASKNNEMSPEDPASKNTEMSPKDPASKNTKTRPEEPPSENTEMSPEEPPSENTETSPEDPASKPAPETTETRPEKPSSENHAERTPEAHETHPTREFAADVSQMTTQVHCVEDYTQQPPQVYCFEQTRQQPTQVYCVEDSEQQSGSAETSSRSSKVVCTTSGEGKIDPELIGLIEKMVGSVASPTQTDVVFESRLGEGSGGTSTVKCDSTTAKLEPPRVAKGQSEALPPNAPVAKVTGAQTTGLATQQDSSEGVRISHAATQTASAAKGEVKL